MSDVTSVTVDNFVQAETARMMSGLQAGGGINQFHHLRTPTPLDQQTVVRMNRDTLYSFTVVDLADGAVLTIPDSGDRYLSVAVVNQDHYGNAVVHGAGDHHLDIADHRPGPTGRLRSHIRTSFAGAIGHVSWARRWSCPACTSLTHSPPGLADPPTRGSLTTWASRKACTYARSWSIRAST